MRPPGRRSPSTRDAGLRRRGASGAAARLFWSVLIACLGGCRSQRFSAICILSCFSCRRSSGERRGCWRCSDNRHLHLRLAVMAGGAGEPLDARLVRARVARLGGTDSVALCCIAIAHYRFRRALSDRITLIAGYCCWPCRNRRAGGNRRASLQRREGLARGAGRRLQPVSASHIQRFAAHARDHAGPDLGRVELFSSRRLFLGCAFALGALALATWNGGSEFNRALASNRHPAELERIIAAHPAKCFGSAKTTRPGLLGRANWASSCRAAAYCFRIRSWRAGGSHAGSAGRRLD